MKEPTIACLCPTYKRPTFLRNAIACFEAQTYVHKQLVIVDDVPQHDPQQGAGWRLFSNLHRYKNLPEKLNALAAIASTHTPDIYVIWEDDDTYLSHHLAAIATAYTGIPAFFAPKNVWSTYNQPPGGSELEDASGRFHASWAYTCNLFESIGGYPDTGRLDFDQQMHRLAREAAGGITHYDNNDPSYVYRWGNNLYHGSQAGEEGYQRLWDELGTRPATWVGSTGPEFDMETALLYERRGLACVNP